MVCQLKIWQGIYYYGYNAVSMIQCFIYGFYYVTEEDFNFFNRNLLAYLHEDTSLLRLLRAARWGLQIIKYNLPQT